MSAVYINAVYVIVDYVTAVSIIVTEKTLIAMQDRGRGLNKRNEIMQKCRHKGDMMLTNWILIDEGGG